MYAIDEFTQSISAQAFVKVKLPAVTIKAEGVYGGNNDNLLMIGGYANTEIVDEVTGEQNYTSLNSMAFWTDIHSNGKKFQTGIFGGYTQNLGAGEDIISIVAGRWGNVEYMYRVSPRFVFISGKTKFATEVEYTAAAYQRPTDEDAGMDIQGLVTNSEEVANLRFLFSVIHSF
jgi:hypothetical protein